MTDIVFVLLVIAIFLGICITLLMQRKNYLFNSKDKHELVEFKVIKTDIVYTSNLERICKYTVVAYFFNKKDNNDWCYNKFVFFDEVGKYNLDDKFVLVKKS